MFPRLNTLGIQLIGIVGQAGAGKDTIASYIMGRYQNCYGQHFASPIKDACSAAFGIPRSHFTDPEFKEKLNEFWRVSPRKIAQFVGTEMFRDLAYKLVSCGNDFWIHRHYGRLSGQLILDDDGVYEAGDTVLVPDVRFQNEIDYIEEQGGVLIHVIRPGQEGNVGIYGHASEQHSRLNFPLQSTFRIINDSNLDDLSSRVRGVCNELVNKYGFKLTLRADAVTINDL